MHLKNAIRKLFKKKSRIVCEELELLSKQLIMSCGHKEYHEISKVWNTDVWMHANRYLNSNYNNALDLGAFTGFNSILLSRICKNVYSLDHECYLPKDKPKNIDFVKSNIDTVDYNIPDINIDVCFMIEILEHLRWSPIPLLKTLSTQVKLLFITTPDDEEWPPLEDHEWVHKCHYRDIPVAFEGCEGNPLPMNHVKQYKSSEFVELLEECGFRINELVRIGEGKHQLLAICQPKGLN